MIALLLPTIFFLFYFHLDLDLDVHWRVDVSVHVFNNGNLSYHVSERVVDKKLHSLRLSLFTHDTYDIPIALPVVGLPHFHNTIPPIPLVQAQEI